MSDSISRQRSIKDRLKDGLSSWQTKSRSVDQSLAAAFDVDVIGGLSRLAGVGSAPASSSADSVTTGQLMSPTASASASASASYVVQASDTLTSVAARFDTTPSELATLNKLHSRLIFPGQVLQVPREADGTTGRATPAPAPEPRDAGADAGDGRTPSPADKSQHEAFLDVLRAPLSPRRSVSSIGSEPPPDGVEDGSDAVDAVDAGQGPPPPVDLEAERVKDRAEHEKFLKIHVRHITDGQGVVAGVLLVTPNTVMFDPNVSDPLVIEHGAEAYGVIAPVDFVVNAALFTDIAHMRHAHLPAADGGAADGDRLDDPNDAPIYFPSDCALHRKYRPSAHRPASFGGSPTEPAADDAAAASGRKHSTVTAEPNLTTVAECETPAAADAADADADADADDANAPAGNDDSRLDGGGASLLRTPLSSLRTPSDGGGCGGGGDDGAATDAETHGDVFDAPSETPPPPPPPPTDDADADADVEDRQRHQSAGSVGSARLAPPAPPASRSRPPPEASAGRQSQPGSPAPTELESRSQRMLKRLSYPLVWMGESLSSEPRENSPGPPPASADSSESVFSKVFSRRVSSTETVRAVPNLFRGRETPPPPPPPPPPPQPPSATPAPPRVGYRNLVSVYDVPELFAAIDKLMPKMAQPCEKPPLYLRLRMGRPVDRSKMPTTTPIMSYGKKKMKSEYWFSIPRDKADSVCRFFLLWAPDAYGELTVGDIAARGYEMLTQDLEWDEPARQVRPTKPLKKLKLKKALPGGAAADDDDAEEEESSAANALSATAELAKESWESVQLNEEVRLALYGQAGLDALDAAYLPDLIGTSEILQDDHLQQLSKHMPARVEGYPWTLVFSTSQNGCSLNSLYRKMVGVDSPVLLVIEDTQANVFGAVTSCGLRVSESFYGTGESFLFRFDGHVHVYSWTGENSYFIKGNNESLAIGAGDGRFGLWLDGDLNQGRSQSCKTFANEPLSPNEDFWVKTLECWAFT